jgi:hypothetical protein
MAKDQYIQLESLPEEVRSKVLAFIEDLMQQWEQRKHGQQGKPRRKRRTAGLMKGQIHIAEDFDTPLDDFKEYMG